MRRMWRTGAAAACVLVAAALGLQAQNEPAPKGKTAAPKKPAPVVIDKDPEKAMAQLVARREAISAKLKKLQEEHEKASDEDKAKIEQEFQEIVGEFQSEYFPKAIVAAIGAAVPKYIENEKDADAEYVVLGYFQYMFHENRYPDLVKLADELIAAGRKHGIIMNYGGIAQFAMQNFARSEEILKEAEELAGEAAKSTDPMKRAEAQLFNQLGARYIGAGEEYQAFWQKEQAIRKKEKEAAADEEKALPQVQFTTTKGDIVIELFENEAPNTVANFISLVEKKKYDGIAFHRVIPGFMAQGGDPNTLDKDPRNDGQGGPGYRIACECDKPNARVHFTGSLSMAHAGKDTGGSQFFLTHLPTAHLNTKHTVFGRVSKGIDVVWALRPGDKIESAKVLRKRNHKYVPETLPGE